MVKVIARIFCTLADGKRTNNNERAPSESPYGVLWAHSQDRFKLKRIGCRAALVVKPKSRVVGKTGDAFYH